MSRPLTMLLATLCASTVEAAPLDAGGYALRLTLVWVCAAIAAGAYAVMVYRLAAAPGRPSRRRAELIWAVIPALILAGLALPAVDRLFERAAAAASPAAASAVAISAVRQ